MFKILQNLLLEKNKSQDNPKLSSESSSQTKEKRKMRQLKKTTELTKEKETQEISLPKIINSEVNLLVFPFFALDKRKQKKRTKVEYRDIVKREGKKIEILWQVTSNSEYGYPGLFDREVYKAIEQIITEVLKRKRNVENPIPIGSLYNIAKLIKLKSSETGSYSGWVYKEIKEALKRINGVMVNSKGTFYNKKEKEWIEDTFHLYNRIIFKGKKLPNGEIADTNYLFLGSWYLQSLNSFYIKPIDYSYLKRIKDKILSVIGTLNYANFFLLLLLSKSQELNNN